MKIVYKVMLSGQGDWFVMDGQDSWHSEQNIDNATSFDTIAEARYVIMDLNLRFFWPEVNVLSIGVAG